MSVITIDQIREIAADKSSINATRHFVKRLRERKIDPNDVINVIRTGEITEQYPDDSPFPSCLELGYIGNDEPLHVCVSIGEGKIYIVTAYYPTLDKWEEDYKTRKGQEK